MGITMAFRWFSSSSVTVSTKAPITTVITVVLTAPIIASPGILVLVIFPSSFNYVLISWYSYIDDFAISAIIINNYNI